jgi:DNA-binding PadR family transcriptional regulator
MKWEITSSLDLFLLALIDSGTGTAYAFREQAGLSLGATLPALTRLEEFGLVARGEKLERNKQEFRLTANGKRELKSALIRLLRTYEQKPPSDIESVLRVCALAVQGAKIASARKLLQAAASARICPTGQGSAESGTLNRKSGLAETYHRLATRREAARLRAERDLLISLFEELPPE